MEETGQYLQKNNNPMDFQYNQPGSISTVLYHHSATPTYPYY